jgi:RNase P subunit RPR2
MKILKRGTPPDEIPYTVICHICHSKLEFLAKEGKITHDQRDGNYISITCPVCNTILHTSIEHNSYYN